MQYVPVSIQNDCWLHLAFMGLQENLVLERARLDAAAAREGQQDAEVLRARALRQQQERIFIHEYVEQQQSAKLDRALDLAAEEARHDP